MDQKLKALMEKLSTAQAKMDIVIDQATKGGKGLDFSAVTEIAGTDTEKAVAFRKMNDEASATMKELDEHRTSLKVVEEAKLRSEISRKFSMPGAKASEVTEEKRYKSLGDALLENKFHLKENRGKEINIEGVSLKTLMDEVTNGWVPESTRTGKLVDKAVRPIQVVDLIPSGATDMIAIKYMEETTLTDGATEIDEAGAYPEAALDYTERTSLVRKIGVYLPVTDEQLEDVNQVRGLINNRLPAAIMRRLDYQLVNGSGSGTPTQLTGILNNGSTQAYSRSTVSADLPVDALRRAMTLIHTVAFSVANGVLLNPLDWEAIRLMKTTAGVYIWGHPAEVGVDRVWGLPVAQCDSLAQYTAIVGDFQQSELAEKRGISVLTTNSHSTDFIYGKQAVRADGRWAFVIYRPAAFSVVTLS